MAEPRRPNPKQAALFSLAGFYKLLTLELTQSDGIWKKGQNCVVVQLASSSPAARLIYEQVVPIGLPSFCNKLR